MAEFDHLAIATRSLSEGVEFVEDALGITLEPGGQHLAMGTHNRLLALGPGEYLEVIAIDPDLPGPGRPRWFALDSFTGAPAPRAWILRAKEFERDLAKAPDGIGAPMSFERGDLRWRMAVPDTGLLPFDGVFPAMIGWDCEAHPAARLPDRGLRLTGIEVTHPAPENYATALRVVCADPRVRVVAGEAPGLRFEFDTPNGPRSLG